MAKIYFNNVEFEVLTFNRNTSFNGTDVMSNGYCTIRSSATNVEALHSLIDDPLTSLIIKNSDDEVIYDAGTIDAQFASIDETLNNEAITLSINMIFK